MSERRRYIRLPYEFNATLVMPNGRQYQGVGRDVSVAGLQLRIPDAQTQSQGSLCLATLTPPTSKQIDPMTFHCRLTRMEGEEIGLQTIGTDRETESRYRTLLKGLTDDDGVIEREIEEHKGMAVSDLAMEEFDGGGDDLSAHRHSPDRLGA